MHNRGARTHKFDFDTIVDRRNVPGEKWKRYEGTSIVPYWLADMDFRSPPAVLDALRDRVEHGIFGYGAIPESLVEITVETLSRRYGWSINPEWLVWLPGMVPALNAACRAFCTPDQAVMTAVPVYPPFLTAPGNMNRRLHTVPLAYDRNTWEFDFDALEREMDRSAGMFILCNPHNPVGRLFDEKELRSFAEICLRHDTIICSDEIHCDLILDAHRTHIPTATLGPEIADRTVTLMSPSKTFNLAGIGISFAVISNKDLRSKFKGAVRGIVPPANAFAAPAAEAAYRYGFEWLDELLIYLRENRDLVESRIAAMSGLTTAHVEATYMNWIDMRSTGIEDPVGLFERFGVGVAAGKPFGMSGFVRFTFACPRALVVRGLDGMERALQESR